MKRIYVIMAAVALLACGLKAGAQGRNEINLYIGGLNGTYTALEDAGKVNRKDLYSLYEPSYTVRCNPTVTLDYNFRILKWLGAGFQANYTTLTGTVSYKMGSSGSGQLNQTVVSLVPQAKFYIPSPRHFRLYGKAGAGVNLNFGYKIIGDPVEFAWNIVPIGCEWGGQVVYGTAEICVGNVVNGGKIGIGFRF